ncbi:MAG TPA: hypothetical protein VM733_11645, partial [Thermoanaerobaculia bacterium]|nr:hypothetical protein [Thermoanaerobaculia bacterium]
MKWLKWFIAGTLAVPLGHQPALWLLNALGFIDRAAFVMTPTKPFGVPSVISLSFWGGVWGIILGLILVRARGARYWWIALIAGAIAPTLVAGLVVAPLKGMPVGGNPKLLMAGLIINGVWGLVTALFYRLM